MHIYGNPRTNIQIYTHLCKSININENKKKSIKIVASRPPNIQIGEVGGRGGSLSAAPL